MSRIFKLILIFGVVLIGVTSVNAKTDMSSKREASFVDESTGINFVSIKEDWKKAEKDKNLPRYKTKAFSKKGKLLWEGDFFTGRFHNSRKPFFV